MNRYSEALYKADFNVYFIKISSTICVVCFVCIIVDDYIRIFI